MRIEYAFKKVTHPILAGQNGVRYFLESILDPHAVVGFPYQSVTLRLKDGRQVSGIVEAESESAGTFRFCFHNA